MKQFKFWSMVMLMAITLPMMFSCGGKTNSLESKDSLRVDTLLAYLSKIDSLRNSGSLFHISTDLPNTWKRRIREKLCGSQFNSSCLNS